MSAPVYKLEEIDKLESLVRDSPYKQISLNKEGNCLIPFNISQKTKNEKWEAIESFLKSELAPDGTYTLEGKIISTKKPVVVFGIQKGKIETPVSEKPVYQMAQPQETPSLSLVRESVTASVTNQFLQQENERLNRVIEELQERIEELEEDLQQYEDEAVELAAAPPEANPWSEVVKEGIPLLAELAKGIISSFKGTNTQPVQPTQQEKPFEMPPQAQRQQVVYVRPRKNKSEDDAAA